MTATPAVSGASGTTSCWSRASGAVPQCTTAATGSLADQLTTPRKPVLVAKATASVKGPGRAVACGPPAGASVVAGACGPPPATAIPIEAASNALVAMATAANFVLVIRTVLPEGGWARPV